MGIGEKLNKNVTAWGSLAMVIVIVSVVLLKFKNISGVTSGLNTTIDSFVSAFSEPKNWAVIVIIFLIGLYMIKMFNSKK